MNHKQYRQLFEYFEMQTQHKETVRTLEAFERVQKGERFSSEEFRLVSKFIKKQFRDSASLKQEEKLSFKESLSLLRWEVDKEKEGLCTLERNLKRTGIDLEVIRKQMLLRMEHERMITNG